MAKYTMHLNDVKKFFSGYEEVMNNYPIFEESYRNTLNDRIFKALRWEEIGAETVELWLSFLEGWFAKNMETYNWKYKANLVKIEDPLLRKRVIESFSKDKKNTQETNTSSTQNKDTLYNDSGVQDTTNETLQETNNNGSVNSKVNGSSSGSSSQVVDSDSNSNRLLSDFPQGNLDDTGDSSYYSSGEKSQGNSKDTTTGNSQEQSESLTEQTTTESGTAKQNLTGKIENQRKTEGNENLTGETEGNLKANETEENQGEKLEYGNIEDLIKYRDSFINIDELLINHLHKDLFMLLY